MTVSSFHCTNLEGMFQNNCLFIEKISFPALMSYLVNVNRAFKIVFSRFTSRNKCFQNGVCSPKSHESTSAFQVRHGSLPMRVPCSADTLENSPKISHPLPPQAIEWVEKRTKESVPRLTWILECLLQCYIICKLKTFFERNPLCPSVGHLSLGQVNSCEQS